MLPCPTLTSLLHRPDSPPSSRPRLPPLPSCPSRPRPSPYPRPLSHQIRNCRPVSARKRFEFVEVTKGARERIQSAHGAGAVPDEVLSDEGVEAMKADEAAAQAA